MNSHTDCLRRGLLSLPTLDCRVVRVVRYFLCMYTFNVLLDWCSDCVFGVVAQLFDTVLSRCLCFKYVYCWAWRGLLLGLQQHFQSPLGCRYDCVSDVFFVAQRLPKCSAAVCGGKGGGFLTPGEAVGTLAISGCCCR